MQEVLIGAIYAAFQHRWRVAPACLPGALASEVPGRSERLQDASCISAIRYRPQINKDYGGLQEHVAPRWPLHCCSN